MDWEGVKGGVVVVAVPHCAGWGGGEAGSWGRRVAGERIEGQGEVGKGIIGMGGRGAGDKVKAGRRGKGEGKTRGPK